MVKPQFCEPVSIICALLCVVAVPAIGSAAPLCDEKSPIITARRWEGPLTRAITVRAREVTLREALDQIAVAAKLRLSYSADLLPPDRNLCIAYEAVAVGDALSHLLHGMPIQAVVAGDDHIVLTPAPGRAEVTGDHVDHQPLYPLKPIYATATATRAADKPRSYAVTHVERSRLTEQGNFAQMLMASVPGMWVWQTPAGFTAQYSVRGASSFGANSPKIYIDGIEVANPLLVTRIQPENIERIEVIRGPQGGALYGADAINGVTNIITRHETAADGAPRLRVRSGFALSSSDYIASAGLGQDHTIALQLGSAARSGALTLGIASVGEYMPGAYTRQINFDGNMRVVGARTLVTGTARFFTQSAGDSVLHQIAPRSMQQYTIGARAVHNQNEYLTHTLVLGVDGYALSGVPSDPGAAVSLADSVLLAAGDAALRTTVRASSEARVAIGTRVDAAVTLVAEHSGLREYRDLLSTSQMDESRSSNGLGAQLDASLDGRLFLNGGLRTQKDGVNDVAGGSTMLPMIGAAYIVKHGDVELKVRGAYGKAIRWPDVPGRIAQWTKPGGSVIRPMLAPEQQTGPEAGVDLTIGSSFGVQVTRYDQVASGLQQQVAITDTVHPRTAQVGGAYALYAVQSVGEISNRGWELQAFARRGALTLNGTLSLVDSRVLQLADGYTGDLRAGDRMLAVPAKTLSMIAVWTGGPWSTSVTAYRALDWVNYDRRLPADDNEESIGAQPRGYWRSYNGSTRLRATFARELRRSLSLLVTGDNLLGAQTGEPDNLTIVPGRTVTVGVRASF